MPSAAPSSPAPSPASPGGEAAGPASTRERILDVALDLFVDQGYEATSLRQIAEIMGFSKAALYYHFASKEDILLALHLRLHDFGSRSLRRLGEIPATPASWSELLQELVDDLLAQRRLFLLHQRNHGAMEALQDRHEHDDGHRDMGEMLRATMADPSLSVRDRVRLGSAIGAVLSSLTMAGDILVDVPPGELAGELRSTIRDIMVPTA